MTTGLIHGQCEHYLDHLAPLCALFGVPLAVSDAHIAELTRIYYPMVEVNLHDPHNIAFVLTEQFDTILTTLPRALFDELFFLAEKLTGKTLQTIWCPHGNSDKGHASPFMEALSQETRAFVYGEKMIDFLIKKGAHAQLKSIMRIGNYRKQFAKKHHTFYRELIEKEIFSRLDQKKRTILFAPTWEDAEKSSSFFDACKTLIEQLPDNFNLIIKPHPNLKWQRDGSAYELLSSCEPRSNVHILWDFPPIYPLLEIVDIYLGDMSSIGYDFLAFDRPMFFLNPNARDALSDEGLYLFRCGIEIKPHQYNQIYALIEKELQEDQKFSTLRKEVYHYCFSEGACEMQNLRL